jgi:hypothetical protein
MLSAVVEAHPASDLDQLLLRIVTQVLQRAHALAQPEAPAFIDGVKANAQVLAQNLLSDHPTSVGVLQDVSLLIALLRANHEQVSAENQQLLLGDDDEQHRLNVLHRFEVCASITSKRSDKLNPAERLLLPTFRPCANC